MPSRPRSRRALLRGGAGALAAAVLTACSSAARRVTIAAPPTPATAPPPTGTTPAAPPPRATTTAARHSGPATEVAHGPRDAARVALTFHGAGDPALAVQLLTAAERAGTHITVMCVGTWLQDQPTVARRILSGGHEVGNHTLHHYSDLATRTLADTTDEFSAVAGLLVAQVGTAGAYARPSAIQHATPTQLAAAGAAGYATVLSYDVDPADYTDPGAALVVSRTLAMAQRGSIVSLHLGHAGTVTALPQIISGLRARGLIPGTAAELLA